MTYSVAIRTLGTSPVFKQELESLHRQTILPEKIVIYIAEGYDRPTFIVGMEEYVWVKKGMVAQRALRYDEIDSDYVLLLDDDVILADDSAEHLVLSAEEYAADCVGADVFKNQQMSIKAKFFAALSNLVFPRTDDDWAFKIHSNGSFSYNNAPSRDFYLSQSFAGPASLWNLSTLKAIHLEDELWMDNMGFSFGDDALESYKVFKNGFKVGVCYNTGIINCDAKTSSGAYQKNIRKFYTRSFATYVTWRRMIFDNASLFGRILSLVSFSIKAIWLLFINCASAVYLRNVKIPYYYAKGLLDGIKYVRSGVYKAIPPYIVKKS